MIPATTSDYYSFLDFKLYPKQRALLHGAAPVAIGGRAFDVLLLLVSQAGKVVRVADLMNFVWPNLTVEEANLRVQLGALRKVLSRSPDARRAIETIPLRGYCFVLPVTYQSQLQEPSVHAQPLRATLPVLLNPILGRDDAIETVSSALLQRRLVTITGPGGIGKTTVAIASLERCAAQFGGQIVFIELSSVTDEASLLAALAATLGVDDAGAGMAALHDRLKSGSWLIVLDTCEHIVEAAAKLVEMLLSQYDNVRILATSREALRAIGEWTHRLPSLPFPAPGQMLEPGNLTEFPAITLFLERACTSTRFVLKPGDLPAVGYICRCLDGIPLALEFAAARVADLGLHKIASHLDDRFTILTRGRRTALPRHRTLSATLDWSYSLLSTDERALLTHLARMTAPQIVEARVADGSGAMGAHVMETLCSLYDKSLLTIDMCDDTPVYRLLDTTRAYVMGKHNGGKSGQPVPVPSARAMSSLSLDSNLLPKKQIPSAQRLPTRSIA